jgi:hypothetical protein
MPSAVIIILESESLALSDNAGTKSGENYNMCCTILEQANIAIASSGIIGDKLLPDLHFLFQGFLMHLQIY